MVSAQALEAETFADYFFGRGLSLIGQQEAAEGEESREMTSVIGRFV